MKLPSYRSIFIFFGIIILIGFGVFIFLLVKNRTTFSLLTPQSAQNITNSKVTYDVNKIPDTTTRNYVKSSKNITIKITEFINDPTKFPLESQTSNGNYEYNITFTNDGFNILFAPDSKISNNRDLIKKILSRLIIAASEQKFIKNLSSGSLFDKTISNDSVNYMATILNNKDLNQISIVNINN